MMDCLVPTRRMLALFAVAVPSNPGERLMQLARGPLAVLLLAVTSQAAQAALTGRDSTHPALASRRTTIPSRI